MEQVEKNVKEREDDEIENVCFEKRYIQVSNYICIEYFVVSWILTKTLKLIGMNWKIIICHCKVNLKETNDFNPNLGGGGGGLILPTCWFSPNDSETVRAVTLAFCSIE